MQKSTRRNIVIIVVVLLLLLFLLLFVRCERSKPAPVEPPSAAPASTLVATTSPAAAAQPAAPTSVTPEPAEVLTPATVQPPAQVVAGAAFSVAWTGPNNPRDYLTIVRIGTPDGNYAAYALTREGSPLPLTAPVEPGEWEVRYMAALSKKVLGRAPVTVLPAGATLDAVAETTIDTPLSVTWTGPANQGDYITVVAKDTPDGNYGNYTLVRTGSPLMITTPLVPGEAELRYMTGQGAKVLGRRPIRLILPEVSLAAPAEAVAGSPVGVTWTGPANDGDYITVIAQTAPDGRYGNYTPVNKGSPLNVTTPMEPGAAELRYMTGRGAKVLARRSLQIVAAQVSLDAPATVAAEAPIPITWTGPANQGDYITVVTKGADDGKYGNYATVKKDSPLALKALKEPGEAELRYMSGQGAKVLARRPITITP